MVVGLFCGLGLADGAAVTGTEPAIVHREKPGGSGRESVRSRIPGTRYELQSRKLLLGTPPPPPT